MDRGRTIAIVAAFALLYTGIQVILNAGQIRAYTVKAYERNRLMYRTFFFGDWIAQRPRRHIWLIRLGGVWIIFMATVIFLAAALAGRLQR